MLRSLRSLCLIARFARAGLRLSAAAFLTRSQTKSVSARSLVQDSAAQSWRGSRLVAAYL
jgi:hypothetical protein